MSWLARSLANSLKLSDDDLFDDDDAGDCSNREEDEEDGDDDREEYEIEQQSLENQTRGVKEDLSDLTETLTRQLRGVASFLAPPPPPPPPLPSSSTSGWNRWRSPHRSDDPGEASDRRGVSDPTGIGGIREDDLYENDDGRFDDLRFSNPYDGNGVVRESPEIVSEMVVHGVEDSEDKYPIGGAVGVTDEVLMFARNIAMHPETWLDFPLADNEEFGDDFDLSDAQYEHALDIERLAPRFSALRIELCPHHMSEECFWKTYFVLLHPRLNKHDAELLSTPQIVEARAMLMQELQERAKPEPDWSSRTNSYSTDWSRRDTSYSTESYNSLHQSQLSASADALTETMPPNKFTYETSNSVATTEYESGEYPVVTSDLRFIDKSVVEEEPSAQTRQRDLLADVHKILNQKDEDDSDGWLDESSEMGDYVRTVIPLGKEEDVSFSDLEDDESIHMISRSRTYSSDSLSKLVCSSDTTKDGHSSPTRCFGSKQS